MIKTTFKRGIAMVELIFALVIMGIVLLSAPLLIQQSINSSNVAFQQESIAAVASHTGIILSKHWDEQNAAHAVGVSPVLQIANPVLPSDYNLSGIDFNNNVSGRTSSVATVTFDASAILGSDGVDDFNDVDDYHNFPITLNVFNAEDSTAGSLGDYVDRNITINTIVTYANDRPNGNLNTTVINAGNNIFLQTNLGVNESHIKFIQTRLTTNSGIDELEKDITLNAFSCNLGTFSIGGQQFQ
jgi:type II secretory pathway pseudopilin PulG